MTLKKKTGLSISVGWIASILLLLSLQATIRGQTGGGFAQSSNSESTKKPERTLDDFRRSTKTKSVLDSGSTSGISAGELQGSGSGAGGLSAGSAGGIAARGPRMLGGMGGAGLGGMIEGPGTDGGGTMGSGSMGSSAGGMAGGDMGAMDSDPVQSEKQQLSQLIQILNQRLSSKKHNRETVKKQLQAALQQYFDADMEQRVRAFDKVKARLTEMESKLQSRLNNEQEIIELQLKKMLHQADGLDFSISTDSGHGMMGGRGGMGYGGSETSGGLGGGMGGGELGGMEGSSGLASEPMIGYDSSFELTRIQRLLDDELDELDPLKSYADTAVDATSKDETKQSNTQKLETILAAFHQFEARFHHLPRSANRHTKNQPPHSWRVAILPLIGYGDLYKQYQFDQPWDSPQNLKVSQKMPEIYRSSRSKIKDTTPFQMLVGEGAFDSSSTPPRFADFTDGTSNTIALIESDSDHEVVWTQPEDVRVSAGSDLIQLSEDRLVGFADGSTLQLQKNVDNRGLHAIITRAGGERINVFKP